MKRSRRAPGPSSMAAPWPGGGWDIRGGTSQGPTGRPNRQGWGGLAGGTPMVRSNRRLPVGPCDEPPSWAALLLFYFPFVFFLAIPLAARAPFAVRILPPNLGPLLTYFRFGLLGALHALELPELCVFRSNRGFGHRLPRSQGRRPSGLSHGVDIFLLFGYGSVRNFRKRPSLRGLHWFASRRKKVTTFITINQLTFSF